MALCNECNVNKARSLEYYRNDEGRERILLNIKKFVRSLPIINNFSDWLKKSGDAKRRKII